ncbi:hypothetical protein DV736_g972, partial [Chaetothyriales sp. CBS 134916]
MGRKPNQVVLQYFDRGSKLDDSSNRYQHTCKACGALFPKGRIEGLVNHLTKKCPSLAPSQKQHIVIQFYNLGPDTNLPLPETKNEQLGGRPTFGVPLTPVKQNFNSLNILAEASRRVGGTTATGPPKDVGSFVSFDNNLDPGIPLDPTLDMDSFTHSYLNDEDSLNTNMNSLADTVALHRPELSSIAASATEMLPGAGRQDLDLPQSTADEEMHMLPADKPKKPATSLEIQPDAGMLVPMPKEAHFVAEQGTSFKSAKPKVRGKFGPVRRQEVREMRQRGACLRCRMLKKTCSNGSPCQACAAIETPRIWKTPCIRTKLVNEFSLYMVGLYNTTAFRELAKLKLQTVSQESTGLVEFYHLDGSPAGLSFRETRLRLMEGYHEMQDTGDGTASENGSMLECSIINSDTEWIGRAMGSYMHKYQDTQTLGANEDRCLKASLRTLAAVAEQKNDGLLSRILLLWTSTLLLVDRGTRRWQAVVNPPVLEGSRMDTGEQTQAPALPKVSAFSNRLMNDQLRAGVEMQARTLNKAILAELERRLVQKQREGQFETFIALMVLLNCFERMCWAFKAQEAGQPPDKWPFPQRNADDFAREGERFADIIEVLADMRGLIRETRFDPVQNMLRLVRNWFQEAAITKEYLQLNSNSREKAFDPTDFRLLVLLVLLVGMVVDVAAVAIKIKAGPARTKWTGRSQSDAILHAPRACSNRSLCQLQLRALKSEMSIYSQPHQPANGLNGIGDMNDGQGTINPAALNSGAVLPSTSSPRGLKRSRSPEAEYGEYAAGDDDDDSKPRKRGRPPKAPRTSGEYAGHGDPLAPVAAYTSQVKGAPATTASIGSTASTTAAAAPSAMQAAPARTTPAKATTLKALPTVRDHTTDQLTPEADEYVPRDFDEAGDKKVDSLGYLQGGREYKIRTFTLPGRGQKLFMLATECARCLQYRDSYLLFNKNRSLYKIIASVKEKEELVSHDILPYSYRSRQIAIVTARSMFRQFGSRVIKDGRRVRDDYWEAKAIKQGFTEQDPAGEKRPGAARAREAAAAASLHGRALTAYGDVVYSNGPGFGSLTHPPAIPPAMSLPSFEIAYDPKYRDVTRPRQDLTGPPYLDTIRPSSEAEMAGQAGHAAEYSRSINQQGSYRRKIVKDYWHRPHDPPVSTPPTHDADPATAGKDHAFASPRFHDTDTAASQAAALPPPAATSVNPPSYPHSQNPLQSPQQGWGAPPSQPHQSPSLHRVSTPQFSPSLGPGQIPSPLHATGHTGQSAHPQPMQPLQMPMMHQGSASSMAGQQLLMPGAGLQAMNAAGYAGVSMGQRGAMYGMGGQQQFIPQPGQQHSQAWPAQQGQPQAGGQWGANFP